MLKPDSQSFLDHVDRLKSDPELIGRRDWIDFLFHITDIENAVTILDSGNLLSRASLERTEFRWVSAASSAVIEHTDHKFTEYVRLYFRPKTPTAYQMEGIRPQHRLYTGKAHCPVPVYFVFDMRDIITMSDSQFSNGNLASSSSEVFETAEEFTMLPFHDIYHDRGWGSEPISRQAEIRNRRHSEVIVRDALGLKSLRAVVCRSHAEFETLRHLLGTSWNLWKHKVRLAIKPWLLFYMEWLFVDSVTLERKQAQVKFNLPTRSEDYGPFNIRVSIDEKSTSRTYYWEHAFEDINNELSELRLLLDLSVLNSPEYSFKVEVDGKLAYIGHYMFDIPF